MGLAKTFILIGIIFIIGHTSIVMADTTEKFVRVCVLDDIKGLQFSIRGKYYFTDSSGILDKGRTSRKFTLTSQPSGIQINDKIYHLNKIRITSTKDITLYADSHDNKALRYRGAIEIIRKSNHKLLVINIIELEQYIGGVLYHEISHRWPIEAMKAQAVAARTYALFQMQKNKKELYDVTGDIFSQVYGGKNAERFRTNIAVKRTKGEILGYNNKLVPAYFHSSCGGHTENAKNVWGESLKPLKGVACSFCSLMPHNYWKRNYRSKDIQDKLSANGYNVGPIQEIRILKRDPSNRIENLLFISREGKQTIIPGIKFRQIIGPNLIKSNNYEIAMKGYYFDLTGKGWGHGVGMCQWGAYKMAEERHSYNEILNFYYPDSKILDYREHSPVDLP